MTDLGQDSKWYFWVSLACRVWAVESGREHWVERVKAKWDALRVRAHKAQLVSELFLSGQMQINYRAAYAERGIDSFQGFNKETDFKADLVAHYFKARPASPTLAGKASVTLGRISMNSGAGIERSNATTYSRK